MGSQVEQAELERLEVALEHFEAAADLQPVAEHAHADVIHFVAVDALEDALSVDAELVAQASVLSLSTANLRDQLPNRLEPCLLAHCALLDCEMSASSCARVE